MNGYAKMHLIAKQELRPVTVPTKLYNLFYNNALCNSKPAPKPVLNGLKTRLKSTGNYSMGKFEIKPKP